MKSRLLFSAILLCAIAGLGFMLVKSLESPIPTIHFTIGTIDGLINAYDHGREWTVIKLKDQEEQLRFKGIVPGLYFNHTYKFSWVESGTYDTLLDYEVQP